MGKTNFFSRIFELNCRHDLHVILTFILINRFRLQLSEESQFDCKCQVIFVRYIFAIPLKMLFRRFECESLDLKKRQVQNSTVNPLCQRLYMIMTATMTTPTTTSTLLLYKEVNTWAKKQKKRRWCVVGSFFFHLWLCSYAFWRNDFFVLFFIYLNEKHYEWK